MGLYHKLSGNEDMGVNIIRISPNDMDLSGGYCSPGLDSLLELLHPAPSSWPAAPCKRGGECVCVCVKWDHRCYLDRDTFISIHAQIICRNV